MALTIRGRVFKIEDPVTNESNGKTYTRIGLILDCTTYDQFTGEPRSNFPRVEFNGDKGVDMVSDLQPGQIVEVSFALNGVMYEKDGEKKNFTSIRGYRVTPVETQQQTPLASSPAPDPFAPAQAQAPTPARATSPVGLTEPPEDPDDLPF